MQELDRPKAQLGQELKRVPALGALASGPAVEPFRWMAGELAWAMSSLALRSSSALPPDRPCGLAGPLATAGGYGSLQQIHGAGCRFPHGLLARGKVIEHRRVRSGELAAPVLARLQQAAPAPASQGALTDAQVFAGVAGRGPGLTVLAVHRFDSDSPLERGGWKGAPNELTRRLHNRLPRPTDPSGQSGPPLTR